MAGYRPVYRRSRRRYRRAVERYNYDSADGIYINQLNKYYNVGRKSWEADSLGDPNMTHYTSILAHGTKTGPLKKVDKVNRFKQSRINGYKGKVNGEEY